MPTRDCSKGAGWGTGPNTMSTWAGPLACAGAMSDDEEAADATTAASVACIGISRGRRGRARGPSAAAPWYSSLEAKAIEERTVRRAKRKKNCSKERMSSAHKHTPMRSILPKNEEYLFFAVTSGKLLTRGAGVGTRVFGYPIA